MTDSEREQALAEWIASRPESVQRLAAEFPLGTVFKVRGENLYLVGYNENDTVLVSRIDPYVDYDGAVGSQQWMHAIHFRKAPK